MGYLGPPVGSHQAGVKVPGGRGSHLRLRVILVLGRIRFLASWGLHRLFQRHECQDPFNPELVLLNVFNLLVFIVFHSPCGTRLNPFPSESAT